MGLRVYLGLLILGSSLELFPQNQADKLVKQEKATNRKKEQLSPDSQVKLIKEHLDGYPDIDSHPAERKDLEKLLEEFKDNPDVSSQEQGLTLLMLGAHYQCLTLIDWLRAQDADAHLTTDTGATALTFAQQAYENIEALVNDPSISKEEYEYRLKKAAYICKIIARTMEEQLEVLYALATAQEE
jgi:hypothetical protein